MFFKEKLTQLRNNRKLARLFKVALLLIVILISYLLGGFISKLRFNQSKSNGEQVCLKNIKNIEDELNRCFSNQASVGEPQEDGKYNFSTFKIYSPLLQDKVVNKAEFEFNRALITSRTIEIDKNVEVKTWILEKKGNLPLLPERLTKKANPWDSTYSLYDFPILDGYEWVYQVVDEKFVSSRISESPSPSEVYTTKKGVKMYITAVMCPKGACGIELYFYANTDGGKTQIFVQILANSYDQTGNVTAAQALNNAKVVADTISLEKY